MKRSWLTFLRATAFIALLVVGPAAYAYSLAVHGQICMASLMAGAGAIAAIWLYVTARVGYRQAMSSWRAETGYCPKCGYDLRGSPERCPECGRVTDWGRKAQQEAG